MVHFWCKWLISGVSALLFVFVDERARRNLVGTRRRSDSATSNLPPSAKKKK